jgi:hypothetical protein
MTWMTQSRSEEIMKAKAQLPAIAAKLTTEELAAVGRVAASSIRSSVCRRGNWNGLKPVKLPSGILLWDAEEAKRLINGT